MRREIVIAAFPGVGLLDVTGPAEVFSAASLLLGRRNHGYRVRLAGETTDPVKSGAGVHLVPDLTWKGVPPSTDTSSSRAGWTLVHPDPAPAPTRIYQRGSLKKLRRGGEWPPTTMARRSPARWHVGLCSICVAQAVRASSACHCPPRNRARPSSAGRDFDPEVLYVASMLHDLGLTEAYEDGHTSFELRGAQAAASALLDAGASEEFTDLVREAIALHLKTSAAGDERAEVAGVSIGAAVDVLGMRLDEVPEYVVAQALEQHPRLGFKEFLIAAIQHQTRLKPVSRIADYVVRYGFSDRVAEAPFAD